MPKLTLLALIFIAFFATTASAKDKAVANQYPVILEINAFGKVEKVIMQPSTPKSIREKALKVFIGREVAVKRKGGLPVSYKQKFTISTKHLIDASQVSQR